MLRHSKGEWADKPFHLSPWQAFITASVYGWRMKDSNLRRFTRALVEVARKFGKSEFASGTASALNAVKVRIGKSKRDRWFMRLLKWRSHMHHGQCKPPPECER